MQLTNLVLWGGVAAVAGGIVACTDRLDFDDVEGDDSADDGPLQPGGGGGGVGGMPGPCKDGEGAGGEACEEPGPTCGNGLIDPTEECDGLNLGGLSCASRGYGGGVAACDATCSFDASGCSDDYSQDFEGGAFPGGWSSSGEVPWSLSASAPHGGAACAERGVIFANGETRMGLTLSYASVGSLAFWVRVSSEQNYDRVGLYVDGTVVEEWSGELDWTLVTYEMVAGTHTVEWVYAKDGSVDAGSDAAWIDDVVTVGGHLVGGE